ncbi:MAG: hypothetical protein HY054_06945 [Proteobacteria bacterium]|nr:hypothetical protein [Pseudomonadota bacterium]
MAQSHSHGPHIPGVSFSWRRAIGLSALEGKISRSTGIPLTRSGRERKMGRIFEHLLGYLFVGLLLLIGYEVIVHPAALNWLIGLFNHR